MKLRNLDLYLKLYEARIMRKRHLYCFSSNPMLSFIPKMTAL